MSAPNSEAFPQALRQFASTVSYEPGERIFTAGKLATAVFFIVTGSVCLVRHGSRGEEVLLHNAHSQEFFAEASLGSSCYHCDAIASEKSMLLKMPTAALRQLLDTDSAFVQLWVALLARQLRAARARIERLSLKTASERIHHLLLSEGKGPRCEIILSGNLKDLAHELGLSHEALYRTVSKMEREGIIERGKTSLRLGK